MKRLSRILLALGMLLTLGSVSGLTAPVRGAAGGIVVNTRSSVTSARGPYAAFAWQRYRGAQFYYWQLWMVHAAGRAPLGRGAPVAAARVVGTRYTFSTRGLRRGTYLWRVAPANAQGTLLSGWTPVRTLAVGEHARIPRTGATVAGLHPARGITTSAARLTLSWRRYRGASRYYLFVWMAHAAGQRIDGRTPLNHAVQAKGTSYTLTTGTWPRGTYQWRVAAANPQGTLLSNWTRPQSLTLRSPMTRPTVTDTPQPTITDTPVPPTVTSTPIPPTATNMPPPTVTDTPVPPTATRVPPTATNTPTSTPVPPTSTPVVTPIPTTGVLYQADWSSGRGGWVGGQDWSASGGVLINDGTNGDSSKWASAPFTPPSPDYAVEAEIQVIRTGGTGCDQGFGLVARSGYRASVIYHSYWDGGTIAHLSTMDTCNGGLGDQTFDPGVAKYPSDGWHTYRLEVQGNTLRFLIDGSVMVVTSDNQFASAAKVGLWSTNTQLDVRRFEVIKL